MMANFIQTQNNYSLARSVFEHPSKWYDSYQENGTKYLKSRKVLEEPLQTQLNACAGEIFLSGIPSEAKAENLAEIASKLGEVYVLRFKVNFSGDSRGFAYLQYMNPSLMQLAISRLPSLFRQNSLPMIRVRQSRNSSVLLLRKIYRMTPKAVFETISALVAFHQLVGREVYPGYFEYQIIFKCNEEAVHARRELLRTITKFGRNAVVVWDNNNQEALHYRYQHSQRNEALQNYISSQNYLYAKHPQYVAGDVPLPTELSAETSPSLPLAATNKIPQLSQFHQISQSQIFNVIGNPCLKIS